LRDALDIWNSGVEKLEELKNSAGQGDKLIAFERQDVIYMISDVRNVGLTYSVLIDKWLV